MSATILRQPLEAVFHADAFIHVSTFGGAELGCLVARNRGMMALMEHDLSVDREFLERLETGLDPQHPETSRIPVGATRPWPSRNGARQGT